MYAEVAIAFIFACITSYILVPRFIKVAHKVGAIDVPKDNRRMHKRPIPKFGGPAVICGFLVASIYLFIVATIKKQINLFGDEQYGFKLIGFLLGMIVLIFFNYRDDVKGIKPLTKLLGQIIAAGLVVAFGTRIDIIDVPIFHNNYVLSDILSVILTMGWIIGITNAINLIDGLDGLSAGTTIISCLSLLVIFSLNNSPFIAIIMITALAGSLCGFIPYNMYPAKTFMGDIGTNFMGFAISVISILGTAKTSTLVVVVLPLLILGLPVLDTLFAIIRRLVTGKSVKAILKGDKKHLHHRLVDLGLSQVQTVLTMYSMSTCCGIFAIILYLQGMQNALIFAAVAILLFIVFLARVKRNNNLIDEDDDDEEVKRKNEEEEKYLNSRKNVNKNKGKKNKEEKESKEKNNKEKKEKKEEKTKEKVKNKK